MRKYKNHAVKAVFESYPANIRKKTLVLRELIFATADEVDNGMLIEETLKWGEPSYLVKGGSTVRIGWKRSTPNEYALYFHCQSKLIDTFREVYPQQFRFEGNRAIVFGINTKLPVKELKHCLYVALTYHQCKHLPMLGM